MARRAWIYTRISLDRTGDSASPERQDQLCRQLAELRGWEVVRVLGDRDKSGWAKGTKRPAWEAVQAAVRRREVDVVVAYSLTRLGRRASDLLAFSELLDEHDVGLAVYDQNLDTTTPGGKALFTVIAAFAELESDTTSERVQSHHKLAAERGDPHPGGTRAFGYNRRNRHGMVEPDPSAASGTQYGPEADAVREVVGKILDGASLGVMTRSLNERGILTSAGNLWTSVTLSQCLRSPRVAGLRQHRDRVLPGNWDPLIDEDTWVRLLAELDSRKNKGQGRGVPAHLLTGLVKCGRCEQNLRAAHFRQKDGTMFDQYKCLPRPGLPNCGKLAASKTAVDRVVVERFFNLLSNAQLRPVEGTERSLTGVAADIEALTTRQTELSRDHYMNGTPSKEIFTQLYRELEVRLASLKATQRALDAEHSQIAGALPPGDRDALEAWWATASLQDQRDALARAIEWIKVKPAEHRGGNQFDEDRVEVKPTGVYIDAALAVIDPEGSGGLGITDRGEVVEVGL